MKGLRKTIIYSIKPHKLGLCGPKEKKSQRILMDFLLGKYDDCGKIKELYKQFKSVCAYLKLIAECNDVKNPFDERVVEAYWIGNELLENVPQKKLIEMLRNELKLPAFNFPADIHAHHSFHVLFVGSLKNIAPIEKLAPKCVINCGKVEKISGKSLFVKTRPVELSGDKAKFGSEIVQKIELDPKILPKIKIGDVISYHWDFACEVIDKRQAENLIDNLKRNIDSYNSVR